ncbi:hypothetical protein L7F22_056509 [Adiantum nelumboides]|nr:hypothetical protein [Adiantum nelumboides]
MAMDSGIRRGIAVCMVELDAAIQDDWQQILRGHADMPLHVGCWASFDLAGRPFIARYGSLIYGVEDLQSTVDVVEFSDEAICKCKYAKLEVLSIEGISLLWQLFEFPARIAAFVVQSQKDDGNRAREIMESPFVVLAAKLTARDEMKSPIEPPVKQQRSIATRDEMEARYLVSNVFNEKMNGSIERCVKQQPVENLLCKDADWSTSTVQETTDRTLKKRKVPVSGLITYSRRKRKAVDQSGAFGDVRMAGAEEVVAPTAPAVTFQSNQHDAASLIFEVIRMLRHTSDGNTEKLFELLSLEQFPLDKCRFLEELIRQAYCYNKDEVAQQLTQYRSRICQAQPQETH